MSIYSPHVVILEGILALQDPRILDMLDLKIFVEADSDVCLSRRSMWTSSLPPRPSSNGVTSKLFVMFVSEVEQLKGPSSNGSRMLSRCSNSMSSRSD